MEGVRILVRVSDGRASVLIRRVDKEKCTVANDEVEGAFPLRRRVFNSARADEQRRKVSEFWRQQSCII